MTTAPRPEKIFTVKEVADLMRVSKMSVYRLIDTTYELRALRVGRNIRIRETDLAEYLKAAAIGKTA